jgi:MFS family permease
VGTAGFAIAALVLVLIPKRSLAHWNIAPVPREKDSRFIDELKFGITYLFNDDKLRSLVIITTSIGFFYSASASTFVLYVLDVQKIPEASFGVVMTIVGLGSLAGATLAPKLSTRFGRGNVMAAALLLESSLIVVQGLAPHVALFVSAAVIASACITIWNILLMSTYQVLIPSELYGRIHGARRTLVWGLMPFGSLAGGFVAQFGLRVQMVSFGLAATVLSLFVLTFVRRIGDFSAQKATLA